MTNHCKPPKTRANSIRIIICIIFTFFFIFLLPSFNFTTIILSIPFCYFAQPITIQIRHV